MPDLDEKIVRLLHKGLCAHEVRRALGLNEYEWKRHLSALRALGRVPPPRRTRPGRAQPGWPTVEPGAAERLLTARGFEDGPDFDRHGAKPSRPAGSIGCALGFDR